MTSFLQILLLKIGPLSGIMQYLSYSDYYFTQHCLEGSFQVSEFPFQS